MQPNEELIENWEHFARIAADMISFQSPGTPELLFRGQPVREWGLQPTLVRALGHDEPGERLKTLDAIALARDALAMEYLLREQFRASSHLYPVAPPLPGLEQHWFYWWSVMQHYGAPTRLLDWSASIYVAAYFAVVDYDHDDGAIWVIRPGILESRENSFNSDAAKFEQFAMDPSPSSVGLLARWPSVSSDRMVAQQGHFTFSRHVLGNQETLLTEAAKKIGAEHGFRKYVVRRESKWKFMQQLRSMNVSAASLFPGIDGLGRALTETARLRGSMRREDETRLLYEMRVNAIEQRHQQRAAGSADVVFPGMFGIRLGGFGGNSPTNGEPNSAPPPTEPPNEANSEDAAPGPPPPAEA